MVNLKKFFTINDKNLFYFTLTVVLLTGIIFRVWNLNYVDGLWFDEYCSFDVCNNNFPFGIIESSIRGNVEPPLYHLVLKIWMFLFGTSDSAMRFMSSLFGILSLFFAYFSGRESDLIYKKISEKSFVSPTGLLFTVLLSVSSVHILFSREATNYSLLFFFSIGALFFLLRIIKNFSKFNFTALILFNLGMLYTHTLTPVLVFFEAVFAGIYFFNSQRENFKNFLHLILITGLFYSIFLPGLYLILTSEARTVFSDFHINHLLSQIFNFFTPILNNIAVGDDLFYRFLKDNLFDPFIIVYGFVPVFLCLTALTKDFQTKGINRIIQAIFLSYFIVIIFACLTDKIMLHARYLVIIQPFLLYSIASGISKFKIQNAYIVACIFFILHFTFIIFLNFPAGPRETSANFKKLSRVFHKHPILKNLTKRDTVGIIYYITPTRFLRSPKYYNFHKINTYSVDILSLSAEQVLAEINKMQLSLRKNNKGYIIVALPESLYREINRPSFTVLKQDSKLIDSIQEEGWQIFIYLPFVPEACLPGPIFRRYSPISI